MMNGISTLTRKLNRPTTLNSGSTLSWSAQTSSTSPVTPGGRSNHLQKDEHCEENNQYRSSDRQRRLSLTSLSSDAQVGSKWRRSARQKGSVSADPSPPGPDRRFSGVFDVNQKSSTLPPNYRNRANAGHPLSSPSPDVSTLMSRLAEMETMCQHCADKMDIHIKKLQSEMVHHTMESERGDELLVPLAGLKQVRDVLRGTLRPNSVFGSNSNELPSTDYYYAQSDDSPTTPLPTGAQTEMRTMHDWSKTCDVSESPDDPPMNRGSIHVGDPLNAIPSSDFDFLQKDDGVLTQAYQPPLL